MREYTPWEYSRNGGEFGSAPVLGGAPTIGECTPPQLESASPIGECANSPKSPKYPQLRSIAFIYSRYPQYLGSLPRCTSETWGWGPQHWGPPRLGSPMSGPPALGTPILGGGPAPQTAAYGGIPSEWGGIPPYGGVFPHKGVYTHNDSLGINRSFC
jgi:hypothetical protein